MIKIKLVVPRKGYIKEAFERFEEFNQLEERENQHGKMAEIELEEVVVAAHKIAELELMLMLSYQGD